VTDSVLQAVPTKDQKPATGLSNETRRHVAEALAGVLGDSYLLLIKTQAFHWNVTGPMFPSIHELTEKQYKDLFEAVDDLGERIRALGLLAPFSFAEMAKASVLDEQKGRLSAKDMVDQLARDHEAAADHMRPVIDMADEAGDAVTADLLTARSSAHEEAVWMLRAMLED
jgi:starvation-inducible DNA-binding protein